MDSASVPHSGLRDGNQGFDLRQLLRIHDIFAITPNPHGDLAVDATSGMEKSQRRHCWECLRRCLVCDSTRPACKRCSGSGTACPGYTDTKPSRLRWLVPGRVTSRSRPRRLKADTLSSDGIENHDDKRTVTRATANPSSSALVIPRFELRTDHCSLIQAVAYCKSRPLTMDPHSPADLGQSTPASTKICSQCKSWRQTPPSTLSRPPLSRRGIHSQTTCG